MSGLSLILSEYIIFVALCQVKLNNWNDSLHQCTQYSHPDYYSHNIWVVIFSCFLQVSVIVSNSLVCMYLPNHLYHMQDVIQLAWIKSFPSEISCLTKSKEPSLSYLFIARKEQMDSCLFSRALTQSEMQTTLSKIWTWLFVSFSYDNHLSQAPLLAGAVEYADCFSAEEEDNHLNQCFGYDAKLHLMVRF